MNAYSNDEMNGMGYLSQEDFDLLTIPLRLQIRGAWEILRLSLDGRAFLTKMPLVSNGGDSISNSARLWRGRYRKAGVSVVIESYDKNDFEEKSNLLKGLNILSPLARPLESIGFSYPYDFEWQEMRPLKAWQAIAEKMGVLPMSAPEGNEFLSSLKTILTGTEVVVRKIEGSISEFYSDSPHTEFSSCMAGKPLEYFEFYDILQDEGILDLIECVTTSGKRVGRALLWHGTNPSDSYLDRLYADCPNDNWNKGVINALKAYCASNGIRKTVNDASSNRLLGLERMETVFLPIDQNLLMNLSRFPYMDSMRYLYADGLRQRCLSNGEQWRALNSTNGYFESNY